MTSRGGRLEVRISGLSVAYGKETVIHQLSAAIPSGNLVSLLGPSGCGKSTTLLAVAGILEPSTGTIQFAGQVVNSIATEHRDISIVFQNYSLYPHMSVFENIAFPLQMKKWSKSSIHQRVNELAELFHIESLLDRKPKQLSGGQQQRVAIARAIAKNPKLLLMDEPFSNLDAALRMELRDEFRLIQQHYGITTLFVTHDQEEALSLSDRIMVMSCGELLQYDTPYEIYNRPLTRKVAEIAGHPPMNFLKVEGEPWIAGIRAEDWFIPVSDEEMAVVNGSLISIELMGRDLLLKVRFDSMIMRIVLSKESSIRVGQEISFGVRRDRVHWFDADSGQRLDMKINLSNIRLLGT